MGNFCVVRSLTHPDNNVYSSTNVVTGIAGNVGSDNVEVITKIDFGLRVVIRGSDGKEQV